MIPYAGIEVDRRRQGNWTKATAGTGGFPAAFNGGSYFYAQQSTTAELRQDVDVMSLAATINTGGQQFQFSGYVRSGNETPADTSRIIIEYRDATNTSVLEVLDSGAISSIQEWAALTDRRTAPAGTGFIRVRLIATRNTGTNNDGYFDQLTLRAVGAAGTKLSGIVTDDGLPQGSHLTSSWSKGSGPGNVTFQDATQPITTATFDAPGTYQLKLTANDGQLTTTATVQITSD